MSAEKPSRRGEVLRRVVRNGTEPEPLAVRPIALPAKAAASSAAARSQPVNSTTSRAGPMRGVAPEWAATYQIAAESGVWRCERELCYGMPCYALSWTATGLRAFEGPAAPLLVHV